MLRNIFVLSIVAGFLLYALRSPFYTLLFYLWLSYFRPEQWVWSPLVASLNLQLLVGVWLLLSTIFSGQRFRFGFGPVLLLLLLGQGLISTWVSPLSEHSWVYWQEFAKALMIGYLMVTLVTTEERLRTTLAVICLSLGFEGAKQGWVQLIFSPGARNDNPWIMLGDNNGVAVGMLMLLSLMSALIATAPKGLQRNLGRFLAIGIAYRAITTYSRGGFVSFGALLVHYILYTRRKVAGLVAVAALAGLILPVLPDAFWERMGTLKTVAGGEVNVDGSVAGRLHFWRVAVIMANDRPLTGIGQNTFDPQYDRYDPSGGAYGTHKAVHSSWFGILAELGYPGLVLLIVFYVRAFLVCGRASRLARKRPHLANIAIYARAIQGAVVVAAVGGTFVPFQYNEMLWHTFALSMVVERLIQEPALVAERAAARVPVRNQTALAR